MTERDDALRQLVEAVREWQEASRAVERSSGDIAKTLDNGLLTKCNRAADRVRTFDLTRAAEQETKPCPKCGDVTADRKVECGMCSWSWSTENFARAAEQETDTGQEQP